LLLWVGAGLGLGLALASLAIPAWGRSSDRLSPGVAAVVNGQAISKSDYESALRTIEELEQRPAENRDRQAAIDRLIDDELMIEYGLKLGVARDDPTTRQALLSAVCTAERVRGSARRPSDEELEQYYIQIRPQLRTPGKLRLLQIVARARDGTDKEEARARAADAVRRLRSGEPIESVRAAVEAPGENAVPDRALSMDELTGLVGPIAAQRATELTVGQVSDVIGNDKVFRVVKLIEKLPPDIPTFEDARDVVLRRYKDRAADAALAEKRAELRKAAHIRIAPELP
jgi:hypothetical protein